MSVDFIQRVKAIIGDRNLLNPEESVLVAVSGGVDSIVLLEVLHQLGYETGIAHVNYQLRGEDSDGDQAFVEKLAKEQKMPFHLKVVELDAGAAQSTQMQARDIRYEWFKELVETQGYDRIATAHHLDDSLETVILNLTRGTGLAGLTGVPAQIGMIIRPLHGFTKSEIVEFARSQRLVWREDVSNASDLYQRNLIRNQVLPKLKEINPSLQQTFATTLERLDGTMQLVQQQVEDIRTHYFIVGDMLHEIDLSWFDGSASHMVILNELLKPYKASFSLTREIGNSSSSGKQFFTDTHSINLDRNRLLIRPNVSGSDEFVEIDDELNATQWKNKTISFEVRNAGEFRKDIGEHYAQCDYDRISFPICVRSWQEGDTFVPLGMDGKKKLSDFMIDSKIPLTLKKDIPVFETGGEIFWMGGYRLDDRFKVTDRTKRILCIKLD